MSETKDKEKQTEENQEKKTLSLGKGTLSLKGGSSKAPPVQNLSQGRGKTVAVEVRRKRVGGQAAPATPSPESDSPDDSTTGKSALRQLTAEEREARMRALQQAEIDAKRKKEEDAKAAKSATDAEAKKAAAQEPALSKEELSRQKELEELQKIEEEERLKAEAERQALEKQFAAPQPAPAHHKGKKDIFAADAEEEESYRERMKKQAARKPSRSGGADKRRGGKLTVTQVLNEDYERDRGPSLAAQRRAREKARMSMQGESDTPKKISRDVIVPETITVQELANRMAEQGSELVKSLMKMGVMATINQTIDADTAELLVIEFGHKIRRVTDADIEAALISEDDNAADLLPRPPVVTIMGHVDHGKTSLLDALRSTDVVAGEAGGITQHIGAYQITRPNGQKITFLDTPGHAAFTQMRARGANVTDLVILVVAANDSLMPQTIEAIHHAKAANVPIIVAVNKVDLPDSDPQKVKNDLLQHEVIVEDFSGETQCIEVSALKKLNLDALEEAILLQAEMLELKANPNRPAVGAVIEAKLEQGRGNVATVLIQHGTLKVGDIFVVGSEWGKVRALMDDHGKNISEALPGQPVEVLGLNGAPEAGDHFIVTQEESKARSISEYRQRKKREAATVRSVGAGSSFEQMLEAAREGEKQALGVVIKGDVHGSVEAIAGSLKKIEEENEDVIIRVLHSSVGAITEADVTLANASKGMIIGFNVRANTQAREMAERDGIELRYYNVIYDVIDDAKKVLSGMLAPTVREEYLGQAEIRQVFRITKVGNIAGCMVTGGTVKRGSGVRLLRDNVVIHEGRLKTLKRYQDEVKEVKEGMECGMAFENYEDIKEGDVIECFDIVQEARTVE